MDDTPSGHYFDVTPAAPSARHTVPLALPDLNVDLLSDRGVFSNEHVDPGTRLLLLDGPLPDPSMNNVLDLGCGYGAISVALAKRSASTQVWAVDVNERAVELARENAARLGLDNLTASTPDGVPSEIRFDGIWSNPPVRVGKAVLHELLLSWLDRLSPGSHATLVVQKNLGADSLQRWLTDQGWPTARLTSRAGYRLLDVARGAAS